VKHSYNLQTGDVDLRLEELDLTEPGGRFADATNKAPARLDVTAKGDDGEVFLDWSAGFDDDFDGCTIRYSTTAYPKTIEEGTLLGDFAATVFSTKHMSLSNGTTYYYSLWAKDTGSPTKYSKPVYAAATPQAAPGAPISLTATAGDELVDLAWSPPLGTLRNTVGYIVRYRTDGSYPSSTTDGTLAGAAQLGEDSLRVTDLQNGLRYQFAVWAIDSSGNTSSAATVDAVPDFDPEEISDYIESNWVAHSLLATVADGGTISDLPDSSSAGHDLETAHASYRPTLDHAHADFNDLAVVECDPATGWVLQADSLWDPFSEGGDRGGMIIIVGAMDVIDTGNTFISRYAGGNNYLFYWRGANCILYEDNTSGAAGGYAWTAATMTAGEANIYVMRYMPKTEVRIYKDGIAEPHHTDDDGDAPDTVEDTGATIPIAVGATYLTGNSLDGRWAQIICVSEANMGVLEKLLGKLRRKYQLGTNPTGLGDFNDDFDEDFRVRGPSFNLDFDDDFDVLTTA